MAPWPWHFLQSERLRCVAIAFRTICRQRCGCELYCRRAGTGNAGDADDCCGRLVPPQRPGRVENSDNSSTRDTGQQTTRCDARFLKHEICADKRRGVAFETDCTGHYRLLRHLTNVIETGSQYGTLKPFPCPAI